MRRHTSAPPPHPSPSAPSSLGTSPRSAPSPRGSPPPEHLLDVAATALGSARARASHRRADEQTHEPRLPARNASTCAGISSGSPRTDPSRRPRRRRRPGGAGLFPAPATTAASSSRKSSRTTAAASLSSPRTNRATTSLAILSVRRPRATARQGPTRSGDADGGRCSTTLSLCRRQARRARSSRPGGRWRRNSPRRARP